MGRAQEQQGPADRTGDRVQKAQTGRGEREAERVAGCRGVWDGLARWGRSCNASTNDWLAGTRCATRQCVPFVMDWCGWVDVTKQIRGKTP